MVDYLALILWVCACDFFETSGGRRPTRVSKKSRPPVAAVGATVMRGYSLKKMLHGLPKMGPLAAHLQGVRPLLSGGGQIGPPPRGAPPFQKSRRDRWPPLSWDCRLRYNKRSNWPDVVTVGLSTSVTEIVSHPLIAAFGFGRQSLALVLPSK